MTGFLALLAFHLHLLGDLVGSRGPDGYQWPIPYLLPFSTDWNLTWQYQWELDAWPNILVTLLLLGVTLYLSWKRGHSPLELVSQRADAAFVSRIAPEIRGAIGSHLNTTCSIAPRRGFGPARSRHVVRHAG